MDLTNSLKNKLQLEGKEQIHEVISHTKSFDERSVATEIKPTGTGLTVFLIFSVKVYDCKQRFRMAS